MDYLTVAEARGLRGLRLVLSAGTPGPWGIAAKALFTIRGVPFTPVIQYMMQENEELVDWTGRRNAPVAVYDDEPAVDGWLEIMVLAERLGSGPSLFPDDPVDRALAVGFSAEICGHGGFGWSRRLTMTSGAPPMPDEAQAAREKMMRAYGQRPGAGDGAVERSVGILRGLSAQLHRQREAGSEYLVGDRLSACDVHWAAFSQLVQPLSHEDCPMSPDMRAIYSQIDEGTAAAVDPILIEHRDLVFRRHIGLPMDF